MLVFIRDIQRNQFVNCFDSYSKAIRLQNGKEYKDIDSGMYVQVWDTNYKEELLSDCINR